LSRKTKNAALALCAAGAVALTGTAVAAGGTSGTQRDRDRGAAEQPLTGETATKVRKAAQAAVPNGTIVRVETDRGGVYEAHVRRADGTEVEVKVDASFAVTSVEEHERRRP
jgi:uncharacterized membrane protein YkoI